MWSSTRSCRTRRPSPTPPASGSRSTTPPNQAIDLNGWTITDAGTDHHRIQTPNGEPLWLPAGGYLVLGRNADSSTNGGVLIAYRYAGFTLGNTDDEIILLDGAGTEIDRVAYDGGPAFPNPDGASMQLIRPDLDNALGANWRIAPDPWPGSAGDRGSPGAANPVILPTATATATATPDRDRIADSSDRDRRPRANTSDTDAARLHRRLHADATPTPSATPSTAQPGDVVINEILQNPAAVADTAGEWFEVYNAAEPGHRPERLDHRRCRHGQPPHPNPERRALVAARRRLPGVGPQRRLQRQRRRVDRLSLCRLHPRQRRRRNHPAGWRQAQRSTAWPTTAARPSPTPTAPPCN